MPLQSPMNAGPTPIGRPLSRVYARSEGTVPIMLTSPQRRLLSAEHTASPTNQSAVLGARTVLADCLPRTSKDGHR